MVVIEYEYSDSRVFTATVIEHAGKGEFLCGNNVIMLAAINHHEKVTDAFGKRQSH